MTSTPDEDGAAAGPGDLDVALLRRVHFQLYVSERTPEAHWRLLSGNHRELGRSAVSARGVEDARVDIAFVQRRLAGAQPVVRPAAGHRWEWRLVDADGVLAVSGHAFDRKLRCVRAAEQFVLLAPTAPIARNLIATGARRGARAVSGVLRQA